MVAVSGHQRCHITIAAGCRLLCLEPASGTGPLHCRRESQKKVTDGTLSQTLTSGLSPCRLAGQRRCHRASAENRNADMMARVDITCPGDPWLPCFDSQNNSVLVGEPSKGEGRIQGHYSLYLVGTKLQIVSTTPA